MNKLEIDGRLTRDAETKALSSSVVCNFSIAHKDEKAETTSFFEVNAWGPIAEQCRDLKKGTLVTIEASIKEEKWIDKKDGSNRSKVKIKARKVVVANETPF